MIRSKQLVLSSAAVFVLDEADRLLEGAMCSQTAELYEALPRRKQVCLVFMYTVLHRTTVLGIREAVIDSHDWTILRGHT